MGRLRRWTVWVGALALGFLAGCGPIEPIQANDGGNGDGSLPDASEPPLTGTSLWPLTTGSTWKYQIDDPLKGRFIKDVEILGEQPIPGRNESAIVMHSAQPHLDETSWQIISDGVVYRIREEDRIAGALARVMTWNPAVIKSLAEPRPVGWTNAATVMETELNGTGALMKEKQKEFVWTVEAVNATITTAAGTWDNAIRLKRGRPDKIDWEDRTYWLVPGVGKVLETGERREELIQYDVKP